MVRLHISSIIQHLFLMFQEHEEHGLKLLELMLLHKLLVNLMIRHESQMDIQHPSSRILLSDDEFLIFQHGILVQSRILVQMPLLQLLSIIDLIEIRKLDLQNNLFQIIQLYFLLHFQIKLDYRI